MKNIVEYINEGIFGDNVKSAIKINGVTIYEPEWKLCEEYYQKRRDKYFQRFGDRNKVYLGDLENEYDIVYNEKDCIVAVNSDPDSEWGQDIYILSPETIYMNHETGEIGDGRQYVFSLNDIDDANDFDICFNWCPKIAGKWIWLCGCHGSGDRKRVKDAMGVIQGYMPETISKKATDIIKKYMKD